MSKTIFTTLAMGVAILVAQTNADESDHSALGLSNEPITNEENRAGKGPSTSPEVVLQLKYDGGELNRIYLTQFRKKMKSWVPSVPARIDLCADLCHAGLGGPPCGHSCLDMLPIGLQTALLSTNASEPVYGEPRTDVCPTLCRFKLGEPLCHCAGVEVDEETEWPAVCNAFCASDGYNLRGCPACTEAAASPLATSPLAATSRAMSAGWSAWCDVQCVQGHGGAACNCHRTPFL